MKSYRGLTIYLSCLGVFVWAYSAIMFDPRVADDDGQISPEDEHILTEAIIVEAKNVIHNASKPDHLKKRDAHPAPHGCVKAHFKVREDIRELGAIKHINYQHGVLKEPGKVYEAWIRFSNGLFGDDTMMDARGMAIKLMGVEGEKLLGTPEYSQYPSNPESINTAPDLKSQGSYKTQDFIMINNSTFPIAGLKEFMEFFRLQGQGNTLGYFFGWDPLQWHLREMRVGFGMLKRAASPLSMAYFSMVPYRLGLEGESTSHAIKFSVLPCDPDIKDRCVEWKEPLPEPLTPTYLHDQMVEDLKLKVETGPDAVVARFAFRIQVQLPNANMPVENTSIEWSEKLSPYIQVAELQIPAQDFDSEEQNVFCEDLSFAPWHALPEHEPIGQLNRARRIVYNKISDFRHKANQVKRYEPQEGFCLHLDGKPCEPTNSTPELYGGQ